jgi:hypothetical protein
MQGMMIFRFLLYYTALVLLVAAAVMVLWNWLLPDLLDLPAIDFLQALGLLFLGRLLTGGTGSFFRNRWNSTWTGYMQSKMKSMSPEEQERFRRKWQDRCDKWQKGE